jgi:non-homologous end joining protein Ku
MAGERGQRTTLVFGGVAVDVSLSKASAKPKDAAHDTRRMIGDEPAEVARERALAAWTARNLTPTEQRAHALVNDGRGDERNAEHSLAEERWTVADDVLADEPLASVRADAGDPFADLPPERVEQGVLLESGEFVDLTDRLAEIDARTRVEGMEVLATIASSSVPRTRVRDAHWIGLAPGSSSGAKVLALLWRALRHADEAAVVRWTKRTNQAAGIIVPIGRLGQGAALCLLELEWAANLRAPGPRACAPLDVEVSEREMAAAVRLVDAIGKPASFVDSLHDERAVKRAELLGAAREGSLDRYTPPTKPTRTVAGVDVADALEAAASR